MFTVSCFRANMHHMKLWGEQNCQFPHSVILNDVLFTPWGTCCCQLKSFTDFMFNSGEKTCPWKHCSTAPAVVKTSTGILHNFTMSKSQWSIGHDYLMLYLFWFGEITWNPMKINSFSENLVFLWVHVFLKSVSQCFSTLESIETRRIHTFLWCWSQTVWIILFELCHKNAN